MRTRCGCQPDVDELVRDQEPSPDQLIEEPRRSESIPVRRVGLVDLSIQNTFAPIDKPTWVTERSFVPGDIRYRSLASLRQLLFSFGLSGGRSGPRIVRTSRRICDLKRKGAARIEAIRT
jgi:hypothetical protein